MTRYTDEEAIERSKDVLRRDPLWAEAERDLNRALEYGEYIAKATQLIMDSFLRKK